MQRPFLKYILRSRCKFDINREEVTSIRDGIEKLVQTLLLELGQKNPIFKLCELMPTGSAYENTKVGNPDEFDFMVVLALSNVEKIELSRGCTPWHTKVRFISGRTLYNKYMMQETVERKDFLGEPSGLVHDFWKALSCLVNNERYSIATLQGTIKSKPSKIQKLLFEYVKHFSHAEDPTNHDPGLVHLKGMEIGVDLMLAIKHPEIASITEIPGFPKDFKDLVLKTGCHIVAKSCHIKHFPDPSCWFISFAAVELEIIKGVDDKHKDAYRILKSLLIGEINYPGKCLNLSSYMLKTALIFHVYGDNKCSGPCHYEVCIDAILEYLKKGFYDIHMPCFLARDLNVWGHLIEIPCFNWHFQLNEDEKLVGEEGMYALLWMKLWHIAVDATKKMFHSDSVAQQGKWLTIMDRFGFFKAAVRCLLNEYYTSGHVYRSKRTRENLKHDHLSPMVNKRFPWYIKKLNEIYNLNEDII